MTGEPWQLGPLHVPPGKALRGVFPIDVGVAQIDFPIILINGTHPDPVVLVTAGMDGDEFTGSAAALRLFDVLDPAQIAGRVMICPILDPLSFEAGHSQNPLDGLFLKHVFPGDLEGKPTQRLAHFIYHNFLEHADVWIDLHSAETGEAAIPFVWTAQDDDAQVNEQNRVLLNHSAAPVGLLHPPITWETATAATTANVALLISQAGQRGQTDHDAMKFHLGVVGNVLAKMDMLPAQPDATEPTIYLDHEPILAAHTGVWTPQVAPGQMVKTGDVIGTVRTLDGSETLQEAKSTVDGLVLAVHNGLATRPRLRLALIAHRPA